MDGGPGRDTAVLNQFYGGVADAVTPAGIALRYDMPPGRLAATGAMDFASVETLRFLDGSLYTDPDTAGGRAYALFRAMLGRAPDTASLGYWDNAAQSYGEGAAAQGLLASAEAQARLGPFGGAGFVSALFRDALGREPEGAGREFWTGRLSDGASRAAVAAGIAGSEEAQSAHAPAFAGGVFAVSPLAAAVLRVELAAYGRPLDADAVAREIDDLRSGRKTLRVQEQEEAIAGVVSGAFGVGPRLSNAEFVDRVIQNAHGVPDPVASAYYTARLDAGAGTLADVLHAYAFSPGIDARLAPYITDHGLLLA